MGRQFRNDYCELAHPRILEALNKYSAEQNTVYGLDYHSKNAGEYIKKIFGAPNSEVHFICGGTLTNVLVISYILKHYEGVISADTGHINVHETAAVEGRGFKIITVPNINGKITPNQIREVMKKYNDEHMVKPRMVYISDSTEIGTIYTKQELSELYKTCKENNLIFYIDGARLGSALTSKENDVDTASLGSLCDAFYVGGNKNGLFLAEALVLNNASLQRDFRYHIKNQGAMLAKGYVVGIQFEEAFKDGLYFDLAKSTNDVADYLKEGFRKLGLEMLPSPTNQIFVTLAKKQAELLMKEFGCELWEDKGEEITIRFVVSYMTTKEDVDNLLDFIKTNI